MCHLENLNYKCFLLKVNATFSIEYSNRYSDTIASVNILRVMGIRHFSNKSNFSTGSRQPNV